MITDAQLNRLYFAAEAVFSEIDKTHLRAEHRAKVGVAISKFRKTIIRLGKKKALGARTPKASK